MKIKTRIFLFLLFLYLSYPAQSFSFERIISLQPSITEILFALDQGKKIVGNTEYCRFPEAAKKIEKIGGYSTPNLEKILSLRPDLVMMTTDDSPPKVEAAIRRAGIDTLVVRATTVQEIYTEIEIISKKLAIEDKGKALVAQMKEKVETSLTEIEPLKNQKVLMIVQRRPLIAVGPRSFLGDLLALAKTKNITEGSLLPYPHIGMETVIAKKPDMIFDLDLSSEDPFWERLTSLPAVQNGRVYHLSPDLFIPGPRITEALSVLVEKIRADGKANERQKSNEGN